MPFVIFLGARKGHSGGPVRRRLVHIVTWLYTDECWYMESFELFRKFILTGLVLLVGVGQRLQLLIGTLVCLCSLALHLKLQPFRDPSYNKLQTISLLSLLILYLFSMVYYVDTTEFAQVGPPSTHTGPTRSLHSVPTYATATTVPHCDHCCREVEHASSHRRPALGALCAVCDRWLLRAVPQLRA
jgi:hypothetical protein